MPLRCCRADTTSNPGWLCISPRAKYDEVSGRLPSAGCSALATGGAAAPARSVPDPHRACTVWVGLLMGCLVFVVRDGSVSLRWFCRLPASDVAAPSMAGVPA